MAKQTFTTGQILTAAQMTSLQQTALGGGSTTAKTTSYTLVAADAGTVVQMNSASATTITVNTGLFAAGDTVQIQNVGAGVCTVTAGTATVSTSSVLTLQQYDAGSLYFNSTSAAIFFASDAANSPLTTKGDLFTYSTADTRLAVGNNGESIYADSAATTGLRYSATPSASNPVLNSAMQVWQRGTSFAYSASTAYSADRWQGRVGTVAATISRQTTSDTTNLPFIQYCARVGRNSTTSGTGVILLEQSVETINTIPFVGKTVTFSYYARKGANFSGASDIVYGALVTGTGTDQNVNAYTGGANTILGTTTLTTSWQRFSYSGTIPTTTNEMALQFSYTPIGTAGAADYFEVTGVQVDIGSVALPFRTYSPTIAGELAACQRYYQRQGGDAVYQRVATGIARSATVISMVIQNPVTMRVNPTAIDYSTLIAFDGTNFTGAVSAVSSTTPSKSMNEFEVTVTSATQYRPYQLLTNNSTAGYIGFTAEL
jgi:hypothetical protein